MITYLHNFYKSSKPSGTLYNVQKRSPVGQNRLAGDSWHNFERALIRFYLHDAKREPLIERHLVVLSLHVITPHDDGVNPTPNKGIILLSSDSPSIRFLNRTFLSEQFPFTMSVDLAHCLANHPDIKIALLAI